jgi:hypothetical protein
MPKAGQPRHKSVAAGLDDIRRAVSGRGLGEDVEDEEWRD